MTYDLLLGKTKGFYYAEDGELLCGLIDIMGLWSCCWIANGFFISKDRWPNGRFNSILASTECMPVFGSWPTSNVFTKLPSMRLKFIRCGDGLISWTALRWPCVIEPYMDNRRVSVAWWEKAFGYGILLGLSGDSLAIWSSRSEPDMYSHSSNFGIGELSVFVKKWSTDVLFGDCFRFDPSSSVCMSISLNWTDWSTSSSFGAMLVRTTERTR